MQWKSDQNTKILLMKMYLKLSSTKWQPFYPGEDELTESLLCNDTGSAVSAVLGLLQNLYYSPSQPWDE